jgi:hypothetical protein
MMQQARAAMAARKIPPPLTPPHKGEGDFAAVLYGEKFDDFSSESDAGVSLPLVGRG